MPCKNKGFLVYSKYMPNTASAKKAIRQDKSKKKLNLQRRKKIKDLIKQVQTLIAENKKAEAKKLLPEIYKALDKASKTNTIKKNTASRRKSKITRLLKSKSAKPAQA